MTRNYQQLTHSYFHLLVDVVIVGFDLKWLTELFVPYHIKEKLQQIEPLKEKVIKELKDNYDSKLAEFYTKNLIK